MARRVVSHWWLAGQIGVGVRARCVAVVLLSILLLFESTFVVLTPPSRALSSSPEADAKLRLMVETGTPELSVWKKQPSLAWRLYTKAIQRGKSGDVGLVRKLVAAGVPWSYESTEHDMHVHVRHMKKRPNPFTPLACACELLQSPNIHIEIFHALFIQSDGRLRDPVLGDGGTLLHWASRRARRPPRKNNSAGRALLPRARVVLSPAAPRSIVPFTRVTTRSGAPLTVAARRTWLLLRRLRRSTASTCSSS